MKELAEQLVNLIATADTRLREVDEAAAAAKPAPAVWSKKEVLGHLIDSASNNHQRFVRLQLANDLRLPKYEQEGWVR
ncbi:MAG: DinB family protein, partial [Bryobacteraceae bacterium]